MVVAIRPMPQGLGAKVRHMRAADIKRIHYGYFVAPEESQYAGLPTPATGFVVPDPAGTILFDTGFPPYEDQLYHPRIRLAREALTESGVDPDSISAIVNCHSHPDHSGGNYLFPGVPISIQRVELENSHLPDFTYPQYTCDFEGADLRVIDGEHELRPGIVIIPTPGHTTGHQSMLVSTDDGVVMLAGQAESTWRLSGGIFSERVAHELGDPLGEYLPWIPLIRERNVTRIYLSHELMVWEKDTSELGHPFER